MKVRLIFRPGKRNPSAGSQRKGLSAGAFAVSVLLHALVLAAAFWAPSVSPPDQSLYAQVIAPRERKIIWYPLHQIPEITPVKRIGTAPTPQGRDKRNRVILSDDPAAEPGKQLLWRPDTDKKIAQEVPAPNLLAVETPAVKPRIAFQPPAGVPAAVKTAELPPAPEVQPNPAPGRALPSFLTGARRPTRAFVTPKQPIDRPQNAALRIEPMPLQPGDPRPAAGDSNISVLRAVPGNQVVPRPQFIPPPANRTTGSSGAGVVLPEMESSAAGGGGVDGVVLNDSPLDRIIAPIPEGSHRVAMSGAPAQGDPSSGPIKAGSGLQIPGVAVVSPAHPPPGSPGVSIPKPAPSITPRRVVYEEARFDLRRRGLSAPLRPSARVIPPGIEARFHDRVVYTMLLAKPLISLYSADWVVWFAEIQPVAGYQPQIRAPEPVRKLEPAEQGREIDLTERIQFSATISKSGQVGSVVVLKGGNTATAQAAAVKDLQSWQFAPALRDGQPIDIEVVLEIPFSDFHRQ